ncbi:UPF0175 family protein [Thiobaca trueperi]|uniref:Uncharacterized protein UPF0175 n=1 Tax=Thiobaca trueperi TaxID=127458 RepID=A0A4R3MZS8_9GAMM|nr:UPF0175 family protein [Thiobaca trueperi]TCT22218.1 uncharacterized protein UPF0175 [Thiobaca trueperi]
MSTPQVNPEFAQILQPLGTGAIDFFLAASLYQARKISFSAAAALAGLGFDEFHYRLKEHFGAGFAINDTVVLEDMALVRCHFGSGA